jgi:hypothetical protein
MSRRRNRCAGPTGCAGSAKCRHRPLPADPAGRLLPLRASDGRSSEHPRSPTRRTPRSESGRRLPVRHRRKRADVPLDHASVLRSTAALLHRAARTQRSCSPRRRNVASPRTMRPDGSSHATLLGLIMRRTLTSGPSTMGRTTWTLCIRRSSPRISRSLLPSPACQPLLEGCGRVGESSLEASAWRAQRAVA